MVLKKIVIFALFLCAGVTVLAQDSFENSLIFQKKARFYPIYNELMEHLGSIKLIDSTNWKNIESPIDNLSGEAGFVIDIGENDSIADIRIVSFWSYFVFREETTVQDYIMFVEDDDVGFDQAKVHQYKLNPQSREVIDFLFDYIRENKKFKLIKPRQKNVIYLRLRVKG